MNVKMIVTDLDNTLLRRDKTISNYTIDILKRVQDRGILVAFATARDLRFVTEHISPLFGLAPDVVIADIGALARYNGNDLYKRLIPVDTANTLLSRFELMRCASTENAYLLSGDYANDHWSVGKKATIITDFSGGIRDDAFYLAYPRESLTGHATLGGLPIHCIAPEWMFRFKTSYTPAPKDIIDVHALAEKYAYDIPITHHKEKSHVFTR